MKNSATRLFVGLGAGWAGAEREVGPVWRGHFAVRLGDRALTAHLGVQPVIPFVAALVEATVALRERQPPRPIPLADDHVLSLVERGGAVRLSVTTGGRAIVVEELTTDVEAATRALIAAVTAEARHPTDRDALDRARAQLEAPVARRRRGRDLGDPVDPPPDDAARPDPADPERPLRLSWRLDGDRPCLVMGFGPAEVAIGFRSAVEPAECLCGALEALLHGRDWPRGRHLFRFEDGEDRRLYLLRRDDRVEVTVYDRGEHALAPPVHVSVPALAATVTRFLADRIADPRTSAPAARRLKRLRAEASRLTAWSEALAAGDRPGIVEDAPRYRPRAAADPPAGPAALPARDLMHLAYRRQWRTEAPGMIRVAVDRGRLLVYDEIGLHALAADTGAHVWRRAGLRPLAGAPPAFALDPGGRLQRVDPARGRIIWQSEIAGTLGDLCAVVASPGVVLVGGREGGLAGVGAQGEALWRYRTHYGAAGRITRQGDLVVVVGEDGFLHAVHRTSGAPLFQTRLIGEPTSAVQATDAGLLVAVNREPDVEGTLILVDPASGAVRWRHPTAAEIIGPPMVAAGQAHVVLTEDDRAAILAVDLASGQARWRTPLPGCPSPPAQLATTDAVYVKGADGHLFALDGATGGLRWTAEPDDPHLELSVNAPPRWCRGLLLAPGRQIRALDPEGGRIVSALDCGELVPSWMHVWPEGDLAIAEDDAIARYHLGGHLAVVRPVDSAG